MRPFALFAGLAALALVPVPSPGQKATKEEKHITNSIGMKLARIPAGEFKMGSPKGEKGRNKDETQHDVRITKAFHLGIHAVTQKQFRRVMGYNPSYFSKDGKKRDARTRYPYRGDPADGKAKVEDLDTGDFPVENVSHDEAVEFCKKLSALAAEKKEKRLYRLPTEAEWEYACRGGAKEYKKFNVGDKLTKDDANFDDSGLGRTCKVGSYKSNAFGLHDMHGNVWQWCGDLYGEKYYDESPRDDPKGPAEGSDRVLRGGCWADDGGDCRSAVRNFGFPPGRHIYGFRAALVPVR